MLYSKFRYKVMSRVLYKIVRGKDTRDERDEREIGRETLTIVARNKFASYECQAEPPSRLIADKIKCFPLSQNPFKTIYMYLSDFINIYYSSYKIAFEKNALKKKLLYAS